MTCPNCGLANPDSARFCANCGTTLGNGPSSNQPGGFQNQSQSQGQAPPRLSGAGDSHDRQLNGEEHWTRMSDRDCAV